MDTAQSIVVGAIAVLALAYIGTQLMIRYPGTRTWIRQRAIEGYNYLDKVKEDVPAECTSIWQAAYDGLDAIVDAFADDELTGKEIRRIAYEGLRLVNEVRRIFA